MTLIRADGVSRIYRSTSLVGAGAARTALAGVSLSVAAGETVALLGRSGCGKSTLARLLCGLERPDGGTVFFRGTPLARLDRSGLRRFRREVQMVFQDAPGAVDPRFDIRSIIAEPLRHLTSLDARAGARRVDELLEMVELPASLAPMLPSQVSGGQLQRVCIARALAPSPALVILDEAVSNLDLHLQAATLALLKRLQQASGIACLFVTHDLRLVERFADRTIVMQRGQVVEETGTSAPASALAELRHPASLELKAAILPRLPARGSTTRVAAAG